MRSSPGNHRLLLVANGHIGSVFQPTQIRCVVSLGGSVVGESLASALVEVAAEDGEIMTVPDVPHSRGVGGGTANSYRGGGVS